MKPHKRAPYLTLAVTAVIPTGRGRVVQRSNAREDLAGSEADWPRKMAEIVARHIEGRGIADLYGWRAVPVCSRAWRRYFASVSQVRCTFAAAQPHL